MTEEPYLGTPQHAETVTEGRHPATRDGLMWLCFSHLPEHLQRHARPAYQTAVEWILTNVDGPELTKALNYLTDGKDWAVRAGIRTDMGKAGPVPRPATVVDRPTLSYPSGVEPYSDAGRVVKDPPHRSATDWTRPVRDNPQA